MDELFRRHYGGAYFAVKLLLTLSFDGTNYCGWQIQPNGMTVQQRLTDTLTQILGSRPTVNGCSRTDSGVHARRFCCDFIIPKDKEHMSDKLMHALNALLPPDIAVLSCEEKPDSFHARFDCKGKEYRYNIRLGTRSPFTEKYSYPYRRDIDDELCRRALTCFVGEHDFCGFMSAGSCIKGSTVRNIYKAELLRNGNDVTFSVSGNGFLYNMVRIICGTVLAVNEGKLDADSLPRIIDEGKRMLAGPTLPAKGLFLWDVFY